MVPEASKPVMMGEAGKSALPDGLVGVDWGVYGAVADADEEGGGRGWGFGDCGEGEVCWGEGKWIALMDMVGR